MGLLRRSWARFLPYLFSIALVLISNIIIIMANKYLAFPISPELYSRVENVVAEVKNNSNKRQFALKVFQVISDLSDTGLDYYFIQSLKRAKIGRIKMIAVENAINVGKKAILSVGKGIIKAMNDEQLHVIAEVLEESVLSVPVVEA